MNLTEMQLITLLQYKEKRTINEKDRKVILKSIKKNLKSKKYTHDKKRCYIAYLDNREIRVKTIECEHLSYFYNILDNLMKNKLKDKIVVISDTRNIYFKNSSDNIYTFWSQKALLGQLKEYGLRYITLKNKIDKKFNRLEKRLNILKDTDKQSLEKWKKDKNLDKILKTMQQYGCEICFKFWKRNDDDLFPQFYSNWTIAEYIEKEKSQALLKI